jgi:hypothetical protein
MDSLRNPFFASAVATVDRVLASQVTSIFSTQILNNLKPSDIGAVAGVTNNILTTPLKVMIRVDGINLLAAVSTNTLLYTVPAGFSFTAAYMKLIITSSDQTTTGFSTAPEFEIQNGSGIKACNVLSLSVAPRLFATGDVIMSGGSFGGGGTARRASTDTVSFKVNTAAVGGNQTVMLATLIVEGELYS